ncbi:uncharacterized protein METZ01_LOCUS385111 [marine metagenome]|uniref:Uncharacterized protein n=1 Tax=marine metagenome TaxID=408172 RepID=A0A382UE04_9ZZZZ
MLINTIKRVLSGVLCSVQTHALVLGELFSPEPNVHRFVAGPRQ